MTISHDFMWILNPTFDVYLYIFYFASELLQNEYVRFLNVKDALLIGSNLILEKFSVIKIIITPVTVNTCVGSVFREPIKKLKTIVTIVIKNYSDFRL